MYGSRKYMIQSRFLKEAQSVLSPLKVEEKPRERVYSSGYRTYDDDSPLPSSNSGYSSNYAKSMLNGSKPKINQSAEFSKYKSGTKVKHVKFGEGTVIMVKGQGDNVVVDVAFKGVGIKSLSVKYAPMEIING